MGLTSNIPQEIQEIIITAICFADDWGMGRITKAKEDLEFAGYEWKDDYETYIFEYGQNE